MIDFGASSRNAMKIPLIPQVPFNSLKKMNLTLLEEFQRSSHRREFDFKRWSALDSQHTNHIHHLTLIQLAAIKTSTTKGGVIRKLAIEDFFKLNHLTTTRDHKKKIILVIWNLKSFWTNNKMFLFIYLNHFSL